ncbi:MAG: hybrid sensor histidine kinase/response regulator, partial [Parasphingopyxis sp.]|uniref:PAS domain-containing protein n=1 Tax=Parasphingopyxis sp. TaxID=1920299 RepID=UPI0032EF6900
MASLAPKSDKPDRTALLDRTLLLAIAGIGIASAVLLMFLLENPLFGAGFAAMFALVVSIALILTRRSTSTVNAVIAPDRSFARAVVEAATHPVAITDREGQMVAANAAYERAFRGGATPPGLGVSGDGQARLTQAGRTAWRDGRGEAAALSTPEGAFDALVTRGGDHADFLIWRLTPAAGSDLVGEAVRLIEGEGGLALGRSAVMAVLVDGRGKMIAGNRVFRHRAMANDERLRRREFTPLFETGEDGLIRLKAEGQDALPLRLVQVPLETGAEEGDPILFFMLDELPGVGAGRSDAESLQNLLEMLPLGIALAGSDGRFRFINSAFRNAAGLAEGDRPLYPGDLVVEDDKTAVANAVRRFAGGTAASADIAVRLKSRPDESTALTIG